MLTFRSHEITYVYDRRETLDPDDGERLPRELGSAIVGLLKDGRSTLPNIVVAFFDGDDIDNVDKFHVEFRVLDRYYNPVGYPNDGTMQRAIVHGDNPSYSDREVRLDHVKFFPEYQQLGDPRVAPADTPVFRTLLAGAVIHRLTQDLSRT
jgi:hypothetical protein